MSKLNAKYTGESFFKLAASEYSRAQEMEKERPDDEVGIASAWGVSAIMFWNALNLGYDKAALALFKCFTQGVGVKKNDEANSYVAKLMYGVALKLGDSKCDDVLTEDVPQIPQEMESQIAAVAKLVKDTRAGMPKGDFSPRQINEQIEIFDKAITLPGNKSLTDCFITPQDIQENLKNSDDSESPLSGSSSGSDHDGNAGDFHHNQHGVEHAVKLAGEAHHDTPLCPSKCVLL